jgi:hypothetical protein
MKKQVKKLVLAKETLIDLEASLEHVAGGATVIGCGTYTTCNSRAC